MANYKKGKTMKYKRIYIEISNICNLQCAFCPSVKRAKGIMEVSQFEHIIKQIKPHSTFVYFHVKGEPLLHPKLERLLDICQDEEIRVNLTTNGTLLLKRQELLLSHPAVRQINISLHSFGGAEEAEEYLSQVLSFATAANDRGIYVVLRLWNLDKYGNTNLQSVALMKRIEQVFKLQAPLIRSMKDRGSVKISHHCFVGWEQEFIWPSLDHPFVSEDGYCYGLRHQIAILVDGTVVPCCLDAEAQASLGNIFEKPFEEIIFSSQAKAIRHGFENNKATNPLCQRCTFRTKFGN